MTDTPFDVERDESLRTRLERRLFNWFPAYRLAGGRVTYIRRDWREVHVAVPRSLWTRNYVGTTFGGSMYAAVDPIYMLMLIRTLDDDYTVWDRAATIRFEKPGESRLHARFTLPASETDELRATLAPGESTDRVYDVDLVDADGVVHAEVEKTLYVRHDG
jgi:acyl-coenzyme A thioesterase PaaI-like protein